MLIPEAVLLTTLRSGFQALAQNASALADLFENQTQLDVSRVQTVLAARGARLVTLGFPQVTPKDAVVALTLGASEEAEQPVGSDRHEGPVMIDGETYYQETESSIFSNTWRVTIYATNEDLAVFLAYIVKYILLTQRKFLDRAGLKEQRISMGDFEPTPAYLPDVMYVRAVMFTAKARDSYTTTVAFQPITTIDVVQLDDAFTTQVS